MEVLVHICSFDPPIYDYLGNKFINESFYELMQDMAPTCNDTLVRCKWKGVEHPCTNLFKPMINGQGICFTFNALNSRDVHTEE